MHCQTSQIADVLPDRLLSRPHTAQFYLRLSTKCHRAIKTDTVKNCSIEYRFMKPLTLCDLLHDFNI